MDNYTSPTSLEDNELIKMNISPDVFYYTVDAYASEETKKHIHDILTHKISLNDADRKAYITGVAETEDEKILIMQKYIHVLQTGEYDELEKRAQEEGMSHLVSETLEIDNIQSGLSQSPATIEMIFDDHMTSPHASYHESLITSQDNGEWWQLLAQGLHFSPEGNHEVQKEIAKQKLTAPFTHGIKINNQKLQFTCNQKSVYEIPFNSNIQKQIARYFITHLFSKEYIAIHILDYTAIDLQPVIEDIDIEITKNIKHKLYGPRIIDLNQDF